MIRSIALIAALLVAAASFSSGLVRAASLDESKTLTVEKARELITKQLDLIKSGDVDALKATFTERQREKITAEMLEKAKTQLAKYTVEDLVDKVEPGTHDGKTTAKIKMKPKDGGNARTLTTFIDVDGAWQTDTLWFK